MDTPSKYLERLITTMLAKFGMQMPSPRAKVISRERRESILFPVSRLSIGLSGLVTICWRNHCELVDSRADPENCVGCAGTPVPASASMVSSCYDQPREDKGDREDIPHTHPIP